MLKHLFPFILLMLSISIYAKDFSVPVSIDDPTDCDLEIIVPENQHICGRERIQLQGEINGDYDEFVWCENGNETGYDLEDVVTVNEPTIFALKATYQSDFNIIVNGDFEDGDSGFFTDYDEAQSNCTGHSAGYLGCEGVYAVIDDPSDGHTNFDPCSDNGGGGNMMVVNGAAQLQNIWCQDVCVDPDGSYLVNAYAASVNPGSPGILQFSIDGTTIGDILNLTSSTCAWEYFEAEREASGETTVTFCVTNQNTAAGGNDFALDDIGMFRLCEDEASFEVTVSDFQLILDPGDDITCDQPETFINLVIDPNDDYDIIWDTSDGDILEIEDDGYLIIVGDDGVYSVTVTDQFGCEEEDEIEIYSENEIPIIFLESNGNLDCTNQEVEITIDYENDDLEFIWTDSDGMMIGEEDFILVSEGGIYEVLAFDPFTGCEVTRDIEIEQDTLSPNFQIFKSGDLDCNNNTVTINIDTTLSNTVWNGPAPFNNPTDSVIIVNQAGIYSALITASNGCHFTDSIEVDFISSNFVYDVKFDPFIDCNLPTSIIELEYDSTIFSIDWLSLDESYNDSLNFMINTPGIYEFVITDNSGCTQSDEIEILGNFDLPIPIDVVGGTIDCSQEPVNITATNPNNYTINWSHQNGTNATGNTFEVFQAGIIYYEYNSDNGCTSLDSIEIMTSSNLPVVEIQGAAIDCNNPDVELIVDSTEPIASTNWVFEGTSISNSNSIIVSESGTYRVETISGAGCEVIAEYFVDIDTLGPLIQDLDDVTLDCSILSFQETISIDGDFENFEATPSGWFDGIDQINITNEGTYSLTLIGTNGCHSSTSIAVSLDTISPDVEINNPPILDCNTLEFTASYNSSASITNQQWNGPNLNSSDAEINIIQPGIYTLSVTGENGCTATDDITVFQDTDGPQFNFISTNISCANETATISINPISSIVDVSFYDANANLIGNGLTLETDLVETITILATGENGCTSEQLVSIIEEDNSFAFSLIADPIDCNNPETFITVLENIDYTESEVYNDQGQSIGNLNTPIIAEGNYTVYLKLDDGCESTSEIDIISDFETLDFNVSSDDLDCNNTPIPFEIEINSSYLGISIFNENNILLGDENFLLQSPGVYTIVVEAENGCITERILDVNQNADAIQAINFENNIQSCSEIAQFQLIEVSSASGGPFAMTINGELIPNTFEQVQFEGAGTYLLSIENLDNGCIYDTTFIIPELELPQIDPLPEINILQGETSFLDVQINKSLEEIDSIFWMPRRDLSCYNCLMPEFSGITTTEYIVTIIDKNGCLVEARAQINIERLIKYYLPNVIKVDQGSTIDNAFTIYSNGDDINEIQALRIFDRWGNKMFENFNFLPNDPKSGWDGRFQDIPVEQGVYVYYAKLLLANGIVVEEAGDITILR